MGLLSKYLSNVRHDRSTAFVNVTTSVGTHTVSSIVYCVRFRRVLLLLFLLSSPGCCSAIIVSSSLCIVVVSSFVSSFFLSFLFSISVSVLLLLLFPRILSFDIDANKDDDGIRIDEEEAEIRRLEYIVVIGKVPRATAAAAEEENAWTTPTVVAGIVITATVI